MNVDHYEKAEELVAQAAKGGAQPLVLQALQAAQVHATLALADAVESASRKNTDGMVELVGQISKRR